MPPPRRRRHSHGARAALVAVAAGALAGCAPDNPTPVRCDACVDAARPTDATPPPADAAPVCSVATCPMPGFACVRGACAADCRPAGGVPCGAGTVCDYTDGRCRDPGAEGVLAGAFEPCAGGADPTRACGPGTTCDGRGACVTTGACAGIDCDPAGRCWARACPVDRPAPRCTTAPLARLNRPDFVGSPANNSDAEGAIDLEFDDICTAYAVTMISGPDFLRQLTPAGEVTAWTSTTNLNMGEVAVLRVPGLEGTRDLGDVAATYICCATCGCVETGQDGRLGVVHLDRTSATRPLPNVLPASPTTGTGPFGNPGLDTGPYGLAWGGDRALYASNVMANGDVVRVDLAARTQTPVARMPARVVAAAPYDLLHLLVATAGGRVDLVDIRDGRVTPWAMLPGDATSLHRDDFTGRVYAEVRTTPPRILEVRADGASFATFQTPPRLGRIAIAPDGFLYHVSVFPAVRWMAGDAIARWPLPARR